MKFYENPSSGIRVVLCGRKDRQTYTMKLIVSFRIFEKAPKINQTVRCKENKSTAKISQLVETVGSKI